LHTTGEVLANLCEVVRRQIVVPRCCQGFLLQPNFTLIVHPDFCVKGVGRSRRIRTGLVRAKGQRDVVLEAIFKLLDHRNRQFARGVRDDLGEISPGRS
jgi:hypothetical protein